VAGILLVRRVRWRGEGRSRRATPCALRLTEDEVSRSYRGVDGEPWLEALSIDAERTEGLAELARWNDLERAAAELTNADVFDAIVVTKGEPVPGFSWRGYDVGSVTAYGTYSSLFHEAIYGALDALRAHAAHLNSALLLPGRAELDAYLATRSQLLDAGADVERGCAIEPLAIWGVPRT